MFFDARTLPAGHTVEAEICIVGAGPAGITLARELSGRGYSICVLESGGLDFDAATQSLCEGEVGGDSDQNPLATRRRQFGGTSTTWAIDLGEGRRGVRWTPLDPADFERRSWAPYSGWPFPKSHLDPFYERAQAVCKIGPFVYASEPWATPSASPLQLPAARLQSTVFQLGPARVFAEHYGEELRRDKQVSVFLHANVLELEADASAGRVTGAQVACLDNKRFAVRARIFVLAAGGIENARLLLLSNSTYPDGLGNQHDLVGRFFMDHSLDYYDRFMPRSRDIFAGAGRFYDVRRVQEQFVMGKLSPDDSALLNEAVLNVAVHLLPRHETHNAPALGALKALAREGVRSGAVADHLHTVAEGWPTLLKLAQHKLARRKSHTPLLAAGRWSSLVADPAREFGYFELVSQVEQLPNPQNRVTLSDARDRLGQRKVRVEWRWSELELAALQRTRALVKAALGHSELGEVELKRGPTSHTGCHHHMGTTRMHSDPREGVVDVNSRVHGVANLFVAGSSVFPTGGYANPTLTIVALSLRLADHLAEVLSPSQIEVPELA